MFSHPHVCSPDWQARPHGKCGQELRRYADITHQIYMIHTHSHIIFSDVTYHGRVSQNTHHMLTRHTTPIYMACCTSAQDTALTHSQYTDNPHALTATIVLCIFTHILLPSFPLSLGSSHPPRTRRQSQPMESPASCVGDGGPGKTLCKEEV